MKIQESTSPAVLPFTGKSRWRQIEPFCPFSRETFRKLSIEGKAPPPERLGIRCTFYDNHEIHRWLADPVNYRVTQPTPTPVDINNIVRVQEDAIEKQAVRRKSDDEILETDREDEG